MSFDEYSKRWGLSIYKSKINDEAAYYFSNTNLADNTSALQTAINHVKDTLDNGIIFVEEGSYYFSKTVYIPRGIRLIGYGKKRPQFILRKNSPDFQEADPKDKGCGKYLFWFTTTVPKENEPVRDANPGTFYSALSNIDITIEEGNPVAVAIRSHFAQHSFISFMDIHIGEGKAGIYDVGNEMENVRFFGGDYGFYTTKPSPGWPFLMCDTYFENQRKVAILSREAGLSIVRMVIKNTPVAIETPEGFCEKLYMEDCRLENIQNAAMVISCENNAYNQINFRTVYCKNVPILARFRESGKVIPISHEIYKINHFIHGNQTEKDGIDQPFTMQTVYDYSAEKECPEITKSDMPYMPETKDWISVKSLGVTGDGKTDDTNALKAAIAKHKVLYMPEGRYKVTDTLVLKKDTVLIGLHPITTQIVVDDNTEAFGGFGAPKPVLETEQGGRTIISGFGIDAGGSNTSAVACKWMAGKDSYMNDIKFVGGHGSLTKVYNDGHSGDGNPDRRWDSQYWSLWITNNGGGTFKDVWTASPYASAGIYISNTKTEGRIYAMSIEHHVRNEVKLKNVENWKFLAFQMEEETAESQQCQPVTMENCKNLLFANLYTFRVIWLPNPYPYAIKTYSCENIEMLNVHNFTQVKYTIDNTLLDIHTNIEVRPWQIARFVMTGREKREMIFENKYGEIQKLAGGFDFADGIAKDSKGNVYFVDGNRKSIFKWDVDENKLHLVSDIHHKPLALGFDSNDHLLVVVEYFPSKKATINGKPEIYGKFEGGADTAYGIYYNVGSTVMVYAIDPNDAENTMKVLERVPCDSVKKIEKALYPSNRWRDNNDYSEITVEKLTEYFVAPDGVTVIPVCFDLIRSNSLLAAYPNKPFLAVDEYYKRIVKFDSDSRACLSNPKILIEKGEYSVAEDAKGNVFVADCQVYQYNSQGEPSEEFKMPERPSCVIVGGKEDNLLFVTARSSFFMISINRKI